MMDWRPHPQTLAYSPFLFYRYSEKNFLLGRCLHSTSPFARLSTKWERGKKIQHLLLQRSRILKNHQLDGFFGGQGPMFTTIQRFSKGPGEI